MLAAKSGGHDPDSLFGDEGIEIVIDVSDGRVVTVWRKRYRG
jgi:hypothetical protein